jgi:hypothetical protein
LSLEVWNEYFLIFARIFQTVGVELNTPLHISTLTVVDFAGSESFSVFEVLLYENAIFP